MPRAAGSWLDYIDADPGPELPGTRYAEDIKPENLRLRVRRLSFVSLTEQMVRDARRLHAAGMTYDELAQTFGVPRSTIAQAVQGRTWRHVV